LLHFFWNVAKLNGCNIFLKNCCITTFCCISFLKGCGRYCIVLNILEKDVVMISCNSIFFAAWYQCGGHPQKSDRLGDGTELGPPAINVWFLAYYRVTEGQDGLSQTLYIENISHYTLFLIRKDTPTLHHLIIVLAHFIFRNIWKRKKTKI
jgi:hypothetical protein